MRGVDVSGWQSLAGADYSGAHAAGDGFVICKLSQGESVSKKGIAHARKALEALLPTGAYHYATPLRRGLRTWRPVEQADVFCAAVERAGILGTIWPDELGPRLWLDMEWQSFGKTKEGKERGAAFRRQFRPSEVMLWTRAFIARVQDELGERCGIYTGRSYVKYRYHYSPECGLFDLWLASYVKVGPERTDVPMSRPDPIELDDGSFWVPRLWQWTGHGSVPWYRGGKGNIDRNLLVAVKPEVCS